MSIFRIMATSLIVSFISTLPVAASQDCVELARTIVYNNTRSYSKDEQQEIAKADLCSERYSHSQSGKSSQIEASYEFFSAGQKGSEQQIRTEQDKHCEGKYGNHWRTSIKSSDARTASGDALKVVNACLELESKGLFQRADIKTDGSEFVLALTYNGKTPSPMKINYIGPTDLSNYKCKVQNEEVGLKEVHDYKDTSVTIPNGGSHTLTCQLPPPKEEERDGEKNQCYTETLVTIAVQGPPSTLRLPKVCTPNMPGKRAEAIESRLAAVERKLDAMSVDLARVDTAVQGTTSNLENYKVEAAQNLKSNFIRTVVKHVACTSGFPCVTPAYEKCDALGFVGSSVYSVGPGEGHIACFGKK
ncbi:MAG: hypothetical protein NW701_20210 [Nitrospira sp.]